MHKCDTFANCKDYVGTFKCRCNRGFKDVGVGYQGDCKDIDECTTGNHKCVGKNVECKNLPGGYKCPCKKGYVGDMRRGCRGKLTPLGARVTNWGIFPCFQFFSKLRTPKQKQVI